MNHGQRSVVRGLVATALLTVVPAGLLSGQDVMTPERLWELQRISSPSVSPDGTSFVYGVRGYDVEANRGNTDLWLRPVAGGPAVRLTDTEESESGVAWRPDGAWIGYLASTDDGRQWHEIRPDGSGMRQVTAVPGGISNFQYSPDGSRVSFTARVKLDPTPNELYPDLPMAEARIADDLMYRHWDSWHDYDYSHLFVATYADGSIGEPRDLMPGERFDTPLAPFGGGEQIAWSPDGSRIIYTA
ncbi:MAG: peptidase S9, partial [marine benthic group bacterium]|nr:peptidase S9 [Gemmatimonadota bacterium]